MVSTLIAFLRFLIFASLEKNSTFGRPLGPILFSAI